MKSTEIEIAIANHFNPRRNLIVPNVSWGMGMHECDLLIVSRSGYATEIEIKVSRSDLIKDAEKKHGHRHNKISRLYFAIPSSLVPHIQYVPDHAGIVEVRGLWDLHWIRNAPALNKYQFTSQEMYDLARLGSLRVWPLKRKLHNLSRAGNSLIEVL